MQNEAANKMHVIESICVLIFIEERPYSLSKMCMNHLLGLYMELDNY